MTIVPTHDSRDEGQNEDEILLPPGTSFVIDDIQTYANGVTEVTMHEVILEQHQLQAQQQQQPAGAGAGLTSTVAESSFGLLPLHADGLESSSATDDPDLNSLVVSAGNNNNNNNNTIDNIDNTDYLEVITETQIVGAHVNNNSSDENVDDDEYDDAIDRMTSTTVLL